MRRTPDDIVASHAYKQTKQAYQELVPQITSHANSYNLSLDTPRYHIIPNRQTNPWYNLKLPLTSGEEFLSIDAQLSKDLQHINILQLYIKAPTPDANYQLHKHVTNYFKERQEELKIDLLLEN